MTIANDTLRDFGQILGIPGLALNDKGKLSLRIERMGTLFVETLKNEMLIYLARPFSSHSDNICRKALTLCDFRRGHPFPTAAGLKGEETLVFLMRIPEREFSVQSLESGLQYLSALHDEAAGK